MTRFLYALVLLWQVEMAVEVGLSTLTKRKVGPPPPPPPTPTPSRQVEPASCPPGRCEPVIHPPVIIRQYR